MKAKEITKRFREISKKRWDQFHKRRQRNEEKMATITTSFDLGATFTSSSLNQIYAQQLQQQQSSQPQNIFVSNGNSWSEWGNGSGIQFRPGWGNARVQFLDGGNQLGQQKQRSTKLKEYSGETFDKMGNKPVVKEVMAGLAMLPNQDKEARINAILEEIE